MYIVFENKINKYDCGSNCTVVIILIQGYCTVPQWVSCSVVRRRGGRNCFCVWRFWRTVICPADSERLPAGRSLNSLCPGCEGSEVIFPARFLTLDVYRSWMVGRSAPIIFSADLTVRWSLFRSAEHTSELQ